MKYYFDGGCKPNPGQMEVAVVSDDGAVKRHGFVGMGTNNEAEWLAFIWACNLALENGHTDLTISGDSKLVICQALGEWRVKHEALRPFYETFKALRPKFTNLKLVHVLRGKNPAGHYIESLHR
jgi:ribonuclease HI